MLLHASAVIFSLPTQWCFWVDRFDLRFTVLFSAYAEVFPTLRFFSTAVPAFLCLRRGVSTLHIVNHYEGEENFVGDSEIIALGGASNETKDRPLG